MFLEFDSFKDYEKYFSDNKVLVSRQIVHSIEDSFEKKEKNAVAFEIGFSGMNKSLYASSPVDAIIDFSSETGMDYYAKDAAEYGITIVSAISNLPDDRIKKLREFSENSRILWSPNITLGINFLIIAAKTLQNIAPDADIAILEEHFKLKPEISGTALKIADALDIPQSSINTIRAGGIIGVHEILFGFPFQTVRLKHESISREAFGNGAIFALKELQKHELGFYNMEELVGKLFVDANMKYKKSIKPTKKLSLINRIIQRIKNTLLRN